MKTVLIVGDKVLRHLKGKLKFQHMWKTTMESVLSFAAEFFETITQLANIVLRTT